MAGLFQSISTLSFRQRVLFAGATTLLIMGLLFAMLTAQGTKHVLLYSGLDEATMAEIIEKLEAQGISYQHKGDAVYIDSARRDRIRLELAQQGLPKRGGAGYELLDNVSGFGTTSEMFQAAYWRAKEGELARTILAMEGVAEARVHLAPKMRNTPFVKDDQDASASVMVRMKDGDTMNVKNARAIRYLVALAVQKMLPSQVSVIDAATGTIVGQEDAGVENQQVQKRLELEYKMVTDLEKMIGAYVGRDKVKVNVSAELDQESETTTEKSIDPQSRTAISTETGDVKEQSTSNADANASASQNVPGAATPASGAVGNKRVENKERVNYEVSEVRRERHKTSGSIRRMTVAVLVDGKTVKGEDGKETWQALTPEELKSIEDLVKSATGFNPSRGDAVTVRSMPFVLPPQGSAPPSGFLYALQQNIGQIALAVALIATAGGLGFGVLRPLIATARRNMYQTEIENLKNDYESRLRALEPPSDQAEVVHPTQVAIKAAEQMVRQSPEDALRIVRLWLHEDRGPRGKREVMTVEEMAEFEAAM